MFRSPRQPRREDWPHVHSTNTTASPGGSIGKPLRSLTTDQPATSTSLGSIQQTTMFYLHRLTPTPQAGHNGSTPHTVKRRPSQHNVMPWAIAAHRDSRIYSMAQTSGRSQQLLPRINNRVAPRRQMFVLLCSSQAATHSTHNLQVKVASIHGLRTRYHWAIRLQNLSGDRTLQTFFSVALDANGAARIVLNDLTNQHHGAPSLS